MFEKVKKIIIETTNCDEEKVVMEANLYNDLNLDSLDAVELVMALEENFNIAMGDDIVDNFKTVEDIVKYIEAAQ